MTLSANVVEGRVWQSLDIDRYREKVPFRLQPIVVQQTSASDDGLVRDWPRRDSGVERHKAYALQWFALSATLLVLYIVLNAKRKV